MARPGVCKWHDGWVSPSDLRDGEKVWGSHTLDYEPEYWTGRPIVAEDDRALLYMDCNMVSHGDSPPFWIIDINPESSWHYHRKEA